MRDITAADLLGRMQERLDKAMELGQKLIRLEPREIPVVIRIHGRL